MRHQTETAYKYKARDDFYPCGRCPKEKNCEDPCELFKIADKEYRVKIVKERKPTKPVPHPEA
jgi:hypothetical protein